MVREFLADLGVSQVGAARMLEISTNRLNEIVQNKRGISTDTALRLAAYLGTSPQFWLNVQAAWGLWHDLQHDTTTYQAIERRRLAAADDSVNSLAR
jgi:addiction module HigA family antidote